MPVQFSPMNQAILLQSICLTALPGHEQVHNSQHTAAADVRSAFLSTAFATFRAALDKVTWLRPSSKQWSSVTQASRLMYGSGGLLMCL